MASNSSKGAYYTARTRKWLLEAGWQVADMEKVQSIYLPGRKPFFVKSDQFGADLMAMSSTRIVFVQVKGGEQAKGNGQFPAAKRAFGAFRFPGFVERWVVAWAPGATMPRIIECSEEATQAAVRRAIQREEERQADDEYFKSGTRYPGQ